MSAWETLRQQPKWKKKTDNAYQLSLNKLGRYEEEFAIELINTAIERNYQGVVFPSTDEEYETWKKKHPQEKKIMTLEELMAKDEHNREKARQRTEEARRRNGTK